MNEKVFLIFATIGFCLGSVPRNRFNVCDFFPDQCSSSTTTKTTTSTALTTTTTAGPTTESKNDNLEMEEIKSEAHEHDFPPLDESVHPSSMPDVSQLTESVVPGNSELYQK